MLSLKFIILLQAALAFALSFHQDPKAARTVPAKKKSQRCSTQSFSFPHLDGAEPLAISATEIFNYTSVSTRPGANNGSRYTINFCNITVTYTHPGWNDAIHVQVWLPLDSWNGRLQALGGGGYSASFGSLYMTQAVAQGYVAIDTDAGHGAGTVAAQQPGDWVLTSPGNANLYLIQDYASRSLYDMTVIGKAVTKQYLGSLPRFSYFSGCSGGGRQALMLAQRYPHAYDGILSIAPAINMENFIPAAYWAQQIMKSLRAYPPPCEIEAFTRAAVEACDELDGVKDRIISEPKRCHFSPHSIVGQNFTCNGTETRAFTSTGALVVEAAWNGPRNGAGNIGWFGLNKDASLTSMYVTSECSANGTCSAAPSLLQGWIRYFIAKDPKFSATNMTDEEFFSLLQRSDREYHSILGSADPDLSAFRQAGGRLISWHGLADEVIPPDGSIAYYQQVLAMDPAADEFYRFFEAPGVGHCQTTFAPIPNNALDQLIDWVELGVLPETLTATSTDGSTRPLCPYPSQQIYVGGNGTVAGSFACAPRPVAGIGVSDGIPSFFRPS
jgi:pimeloyl-ACP methyl ester carboxylesterase